MANSVDPDLGLHCLPRPICPKTWDHYSICLVDIFILINWTSPFPNLGVSGVFAYFYFVFNIIFCKQTV